MFSPPNIFWLPIQQNFLLQKILPYGTVYAEIVVVCIFHNQANDPAGFSRLKFTDNLE